jgi:hypothetical protein
MLKNFIFVLLVEYYYGDQIQRDDVDKACSMHGKIETAYRIFVRRPKRKRPLKSRGYNRGDNIKKYSYLIDVGCEDLD